MNGVYTLPAGVPFLPSLAKGISDAFGDRASDALILLPTRRAVRGLGDAFVELRKSESIGATLLPRMRPLADIDPDEPPFEPGDLGLDILPSIPDMQRRFELAKLVRFYHEKTSGDALSIASALALVDPLLQILDDGDMEEVGSKGFDKLKDIEGMVAEHFQNASVFYKILQTYWPARLIELGYMAPKARQVALLNKLTNLWIDRPPDYPVIIAGSTGTLKATARLMACVSRQKDGVIVLPGLDKNLRETAWEKVGVEHPQGAMRALIETLGVTREAVDIWPVALAQDTADLRARRRLISESLVPVAETDDWPNRIKSLRNDEKERDPFVDGLNGLSLITADTPDEEALSIAMIMRETLTEPLKTCALVTPDPALARRVKAALRRWSVEVDYSQGEPLEETELGVFLTHILGYTASPNSQIEQAALLKHGLTALGKEAGEARFVWNRIERQLLRTTRRTPSEIIIKTYSNLQTDINADFEPLLKLCSDDGSAFDVNIWATALTQSAENVARTSDTAGAARLWREDEGEKAAGILEDLMAHGDILDAVTLREFTDLFSNLMRGQVVRPRYGMHPRLQILGPLEARMLTADTVILGGLNEGIWPGTPGQAPFLSRLMRGEIGLSLPERRYGLAAHDFAELAAYPKVVLTRSERSDSGPTVASRWIWRLQTLVRGALGHTHGLTSPQPYLDWVRRLDFVSSKDVNSSTRPEPRPPVDMRWPQGRQLSVTRIKVWIRDPYSLYARSILGLRKLEDLGDGQDVRDYGNALHKGLEDFGQRIVVGKNVPSADILVGDLKAGLSDHGYADYEISSNQTRLDGIATAMQTWHAERHNSGHQIIALEGEGKYSFDDVNFTLTAKADLITRSSDGYDVVDYKTGAPASVPEVKAGFDPQLPLTAFMLSQGAFDKVPEGDTQDLFYVRLKGRDLDAMIKPITPPARHAIPAMDYAVDSAELLRKLVTDFDKLETAYTSQPRAKYTHDYGEYDHLARRDEWARLGNDPSGTTS